MGGTWSGEEEGSNPNPTQASERKCQHVVVVHNPHGPIPKRPGRPPAPIAVVISLRWMTVGGHPGQLRRAHAPPATIGQHRHTGQKTPGGVDVDAVCDAVLVGRAGGGGGGGGSTPVGVGAGVGAGFGGRISPEVPQLQCFGVFPKRLACFAICSTTSASTSHRLPRALRPLGAAWTHLALRVPAGRPCVVARAYRHRERPPRG